MADNAFNAAMPHKTPVQPIMRPKTFTAMPEPIRGKIQIPFRQFVIHQQDASKPLLRRSHQL